MSWNEPGGDKNKDPWSGRNEESGPPDLDEAIRSLQDKLGGLFGGFWTLNKYFFASLT
jgi:membrane protease subunit HflK